MNNDINEKIVHAAPVPPFVTFVASAVPMVFDNSMSYYEALCALWKWLQDDVINVINNNASVTEQYIEYDLHTRELFVELKNYVDTYFDNLDVQDEINNKLDAMVEAGTLQEIIGNYLNATAVWGFDSVSDMKSATNLIDGSYAHTLGYHAKNDGGAALYKIRQITNDDTVDDMFIIEMDDDDLVGELIVTDKISPEMLGAYGDEIHDDATPLQACFSSTYPIVLTKTYLTNSTLNVGGHNEYVVEGSNSKITYSGNNSALLIQNINGGRIELGRIDALNGNCIEFSSAIGAADRTIYTDLSFKLLRAGSKGIYINTSSTGYVSEITIRGGEITQGTYGVYMQTNPSAREYALEAIRFVNMGFEGSSTNYYMNAQAQFIRGITFTNDRFVENVSSTLFELHGRIERCKMTTWSALLESRINASDATLYDFEIECPIYIPDTTTVFAQGIYYKENIKSYIHYGQYSKTLTKNTGVSGNIILRRFGNICIVQFGDIETNNTAAIDLVVEGKNPYLPEALTSCCLTSSDGSAQARVWVRSNGSITFNTASATAGAKYYGELVYTTLGALESTS